MAVVRTIQAAEDPSWVAGFIGQPGDGSAAPPVECEFPFPFVLHHNPGRWLYLVWRDRVICRCRILRNEPRTAQVVVGSDEHPINARCSLIVQCPGEPADREISVRGFTGIRYVAGEEWPDVEAWAHGQQ
jgi:hypothetical protein